MSSIPKNFNSLKKDELRSLAKLIDEKHQEALNNLAQKEKEKESFKGALEAHILLQQQQQRQQEQNAMEDEAREAEDPKIVELTRMVNDIMIDMRAHVNECNNAQVSRVDIFYGNSEQETDDWLYAIKRYFKYKCIEDDEQRVMIASSYFRRSAASFFEALEKSKPDGVAWDELERRLRERFMASADKVKLRQSLRCLKQTTGIDDYIGMFRELTSRVDDMSESDKIVYFIDGLKPLTQRELRKVAPSSLEDAYAAAEKSEETIEQDRKQTRRSSNRKRLSKGGENELAAVGRVLRARNKENQPIASS